MEYVARSSRKTRESETENNLQMTIKTIKYVNAGTETSHENIAETNFTKKTIDTCKPSKTFNVNASFFKYMIYFEMK